MNRILKLGLVLQVSFCLTAATLCAQVVDVSLVLSTNRLDIGATATVQVFAQVAAEHRSTAERIFSWFIDLAHSAHTVAEFQPDQLQKLAADHDALTSGSGITDGADIRGIHDTFLQTPGAGKDAPILLLSVPIVGKALGRTLVYVEAGSGVPGMTEDFLVAPQMPGLPLTGGNYALASAELEVFAAPLPLTNFPVTFSFFTPQDRTQLVLRFPVAADKRHFIESRESLEPSAPWRSLSDAPDNSGAILVTNVGVQRYYRVKVEN